VLRWPFSGNVRSLITAALAAFWAEGPGGGHYENMRDPRWRREAWSAFRWFLGHNDLGLPLYDAATGGCRDGLHPDRANENQGAESTLSFLTAQLELRLLARNELKQSSFQEGGDAPSQRRIHKVAR